MLRISFAAILLAVLAAPLAAATDTNAVEFFKELRVKTLENLPEAFTGELSGKVISEKLKTIPKEYLTNGQSPKVEIDWDRRNGFSIHVRNVTSYFTDMYQDYSRYLNFAVAVPGQSNDVLLSRYDISFDNSDENIIVLRLAVKGADDASLLYVNRKTWQIARMDNVRGKDILISTIMAYTPLQFNNRNYNVISSFFVKRFQPQQGRAEAFEIRDIQAH
jgi:hypothetical protein